MWITTRPASFEARKQYSRVYPIPFANYNTSKHGCRRICSQTHNSHCYVQDPAREEGDPFSTARPSTAGVSRFPPAPPAAGGAGAGGGHAGGARTPGGRAHPRAAGGGAGARVVPGRRRPRAPPARVARTGSVPRLSGTVCQPSGTGDNQRGGAAAPPPPRQPVLPGSTGQPGAARPGGPRCDGRGRQARLRVTHTRGSCSGGAPRLWNTPSTKTPFLPRQRR